MALNLRQAQFLAAYLKTGNATESAIKAGYSKNTAAEQGHDLLRNPQIKAAVEKSLNKLEISAENVLAEIAKLAFSNMGDYLEPSEDGTQFFPKFKDLTREQMAAIQEIRVDMTGGTGDGERKQVQRTTFKLSDKGANLERLGRYFKLFTDKLEVSGDDALIKALQEGRKRATQGKVNSDTSLAK